MRICLILVSLFCLFACRGDLPEPSLIDKLRVLAIRADMPESTPGSTIQLDALVIEPNGLEVSYEWYACFIPERGANFFGGGGPTGQSGGKGYSLEDPGSCKAQFEAGIPFALNLG
ncbi:MAG TPA: hypothetical protein EYN06_07355, partial [Myxococcales bacterium]|nr:hypothetical protein [Myxococcales bacterium]